MRRWLPPRSRIGQCLSYVPAFIDSAEPECVVKYQWHRGEPASMAGPEVDPEIELLRVEVDGADVLRALESDKHCRLTWLDAAWSDQSAWMELERARDEAAAEDRRHAHGER